MAETARDAILDRVRQALRRPAPVPHWAAEPETATALFPLPETTEPALRQRFRAEFQTIQGEWHEAESLDAARRFLADWTVKEHIQTALAPESPELRLLLDRSEFVKWVAPATQSSSGWENVELGITLAESLVAESGTIVVSSALCGRAISVLPPIHLVVATADQLVADLETSMQRLRQRYGANLPSNITWISGPSRTADIEKILVLGAHGPRRLAVLMLPTGTLA